MDELTFDEATTVHDRGGGVFAWDVPPGWAQGRGAWGGLVVGAMARAVVESEPDPTRTLRSVSAEIVAPARVGAVRLEVSPVRRGSAVSTWSCIATDEDGGAVCRLTGVLSAARRNVPDYSGWDLAVMPDAPPADEVPVVPVEPPMGPEFGAHLEFRPILGLPFSGGPAAVEGWVRLRRPVPHTAVSLLALVDAWWPATLPAITELRPMATLTFSATLMVDPTTIPAQAPLLHVGRATAAHDGYTSETRHLWSADGRLVAENLQSIALIA